MTDFNTIMARKRKARPLRNIQLTEVSLVDSPANKGATVALFKRDGTASGETDIAKLMSRIHKAGDVDTLLSDLAKEVQAERGGTHEQAYAEVLKSDLGARLFGMYDRLRAGEVQAR